MEDNNEILIEDDIVRAISFNGGISDITSVLVDAENIFGGRSLKKEKNLNWITGNTSIMLAERFGESNKVIKFECSRNYSTD